MKQQTQNGLYAYYYWQLSEGRGRRRLFAVS
jgi:hypothetical protein